MLYGKKEVHEKIGSLGHYFNGHKTMEQKLGLAGSNYELTSSIPAVLSYFGTDIAKSYEAIAAHEEKLSGVLLSYLRGRKDVTIYGEPLADKRLRVPTISFVVTGVSSKDVVEIVEKKSVFGFRYGSMYSNRLVENTLGLGKEGVVRVSMVHYNTVEEVERFVKVMDETIPETS
jgi:selenocysteine lyase/cysteine desulfurase